MADTYTSYYSFTMPEVGASAETWGGKLNANFASIDEKIKLASDAAGAACVKASNLSDLTSTATARTNLGVGIGTNVQAWSAKLDALAGATWAPGGMFVTTGANTVGVSSLTAFGQSLIDDADAAAARTTLGLAIGTNVLAYNANLQAIGSLSWGADTIAYLNGGSVFSIASLTAFGRSLLDDADAAAARTTLGMSANGSSLVTAADYAAMRTLIGLGLVENKSSATIRGELTKGNVDVALGKTAARVNAGSAANSGLISWGASDPGTLDEGQIYLKHA